MRAPNQRRVVGRSESLGYGVNLKENEGLGTEMLEMSTDMPIFTIPKLPKIERGVTAALREQIRRAFCIGRFQEEVGVLQYLVFRSVVGTFLENEIHQFVFAAVSRNVLMIFAACRSEFVRLYDCILRE